jgi:hypothetical protein
MEALGDQPRQRLRPPELIAEALENPRQEALTGTPLPLAQALARHRDRGHQLRITQAYWKLAAAQAEYHWSLKQRDALARHAQPHESLPGVVSAQAAAEADVRAGQLGVEQAQQELADLVGLGPLGDLPLAVDRPHVGDYRTQYEDLFGTRVPPPRIRLIHRTLPLKRKAIDAHAEAIVAAVDAAEGAGEQFRSSGQGLSTFLAMLELLHDSRRAFIADVRGYNLDIAEYAFTVAPPGAASQTLVSMLIRTAPPSNDPRAPTSPHGTNPPVQRTLRPRSANRLSRDPDDWTANYSGELDASTTDDPGMYQALLAVSQEPLRVQKLGNLLHWDRNLPPDSGQPTTLAECLRGVSVQDRLAAIDAYWQARRCAARLQVLSEHQVQLNALQSIVLSHREQPGVAEAAVRLQAARRAAQAAIVDEQLALVAAQYNLTQASGRPIGGPWLLPSTAPQAGRYAISERQRGSSTAAHRAVQTKKQYDRLRCRAEAVIQSDAHRAELIAAARHSSSQPSADHQLTPLDRILWASNRQNEQTFAFLDDLTEYNLAIAHYVLAAFPQTASGEEIATRLAIARSTLRDS